MKAIETLYDGHRFRSRLEARWAVFFNAMGMRYEYEPEGFDLGDGICYLPDFYLPESDTFFEVKGLLNKKDAEKIKRFIATGHRLAIGYGDGSFQACSDYRGCCECVVTDFYDGDAEPFYLECKEESWFCHCAKCGKHYFIGDSGTWRCPCCGAYDGDHYIRVDGYGDSGVNFRLWDAARQARFEFGEKG